MADNTTLPGTGEVIADKDIGGVKFQKFMVTDDVGNLISSTLLTNGRGLNITIMNDVPVKGKNAIGDLVVSELPVLLGARVGSGIAQRDITVTGDNRLQSLTTTADGRLLTLPIGPPEDQGVTTTVIGANDTNSHQLVAAQAAGVKIALWGLECVNITNTPTSVIILSGATEIGRYAIPVNPGRPAYPQAGPLRSVAAVAMNYQLTTAVGANSIFFVPYWYITKE